MKIFLDLDCVLADFVGGACKAHGLTVKDVLPFWPAGEYGMALPVGRALGKTDGEFTEADFWRPLNGSRAFWANLPSLPWAGDLVELVSGAFDDWYIVTAPSWCDECIPGKMEWCRRFFGLGCADFDRMIPTRHKHLLSGPGRVLIDDNEENVAGWEAEGGRGILFPSHHNRFHRWKNDPMRRVRGILTDINTLPESRSCT